MRRNYLNKGGVLVTNDLTKIFTYPYDNDILLRKQKSLRRILIERKNIEYIEKKIAILAGSTIDNIRNFLEIFLLQSGIKPTFYESEYNKYYEAAVFDNAEMEKFNPDIIIVFTSFVNLINIPNFAADDSSVSESLNAEYNRYVKIWEKLSKKYSAVIIQNNMELPFYSILGNLDIVQKSGISHFVEELNLCFSEYARNHNNLYIHDLHGISARIGLERWHNRFQYYAYKFAMDYDIMPEVALSLAKIIRAVFGKNKKCLILDLDNTLWGGVIGDDGLEGIQLGHETPVAESYIEFQEYVLKLKNRGVILAVCSKNEFNTAKSGFTHPDSILKFEDFAAFYANWKPKNENIQAISKELNIGTDSLVFIDDNPAERQLIRELMPEVAVPEIDPSDIFSYIRAIEGAGYFEPATISEDDLNRNKNYLENQARHDLGTSITNYDDFLKTLNMKAEIGAFKSVYLDRIAQLTNKTNQYNLTTRRFSYSEIERMANDSQYVTLYGRLADKFGDNGLISVIIGEKKENALHILLWLMSCRVLKRGMEQAMLDSLVKIAKKLSCQKIIGYYFPTKKNKMVENLYQSFDFNLIDEKDGNTVWELSVENYKPQNFFIEVEEINL